MYVPREQNFMANLLFKLASTKRVRDKCITIQETITTSSIEADETNTLEVIQTTGGMTPIIHYLQPDELPLDELKVEKICKHTRKYTIMSEQLYKMGRDSPY